MNSKQKRQRKRMLRTVVEHLARALEECAAAIERGEPVTPAELREAAGDLRSMVAPKEEWS